MTHHWSPELKGQLNNRIMEFLRSLLADFMKAENFSAHGECHCAECFVDWVEENALL